MKIIRGRQAGALKIVVYGPEGIGKSTFASQFPNPVFCDTEGSTRHMDVARTPAPRSFTEILEQVRYFTQNPDELGTFVLDTADWAERLCVDEVCAKRQIKSVEDAGYGKGYTYLAEDFGRLLNALEELVQNGVHVVVTAHAQMRKFEQPDELGQYDRWELKLQKKTAPMLKEWADMVLFANYKTFVVNVDNQGAAKGKNKAQGGARIMFTAHHPCWDAKNRFSLPEELPFEYAQIAHILRGCGLPQEPVREASSPAATPEGRKAQEPQNQAIDPDDDVYQAAPTPPALEEPKAPEAPEPESTQPEQDPVPDGVPPALAALTAQDGITPEEIQEAVALKGYYPRGTPIENYDPGFVKGVLIGAWPQVRATILQNRKDPF